MVPLKPLSDHYVEDIVVFLGLKVFNSDHFDMFSYSRNKSRREATIKNNQLSKLL